MKYFVSIADDVSGPYEIPQIAQLYQQGIVEDETQIMADNERREWIPLIECLPSVVALETTPAMLKALVPREPAKPIDSDTYVGRLRASSTYKALRRYINAYFAVIVIILSITIIVAAVGAAFVLMQHNSHHKWLGFLSVPAAILALTSMWFVCSAVYQACILFIDVADTLIDIGRHRG